MLQSFLSRAALILISSVLAVLGVACSQEKQTGAILRNQQSVVTDNQVTPSPGEPTAPVIPEPEDLPPSVMEPSSFELGLDKAAGALSISQSAQSPDDWNLVASQFQDAIALMKKVRRQSSEFAIAQAKISEYQLQVKYALRKAAPSPPPVAKANPPKIVVAVPQVKTSPQVPIPVPPPVRVKLPPTRPIFSSSEILPSEKEVFVAPIRRRVGGTPIVTVTFNGQQQFDMIVDTGASGTVITQQMANALGIVPVGKAKANTASSKAVEFPVGYVDSMAVGGVRVNKVPVAIAGLELETGLLGHDFFGNYDVTIKRNVVEFRPQSRSQINPSETGLIAPILPKEYRSVGSP
ncbi:retropepsin-like aspartic protease family protein [Halotia branconii]|uniref:Retropepsin-like aspartic protease n=1 Tax=Halotia branconii CENA392 TaxID=1539056 RepID=A0AAJ6NT88_9CYAN|nr:retropepsin-like aspartic protease [Halotia branconii]WGV26123.1 retropepsin-like aspartic protease [Halotia branconii CENA392]